MEDTIPENTDKIWQLPTRGTQKDSMKSIETTHIIPTMSENHYKMDHKTTEQFQ